MRSLKVHGGTPSDLSESSLCTTCKHALIIKGIPLKDKIVRCNMLGRDLHFSVKECRLYLDQNHPYVHEMLEIAWILVTKSNAKQIGFMRVKDMSDEDRRKNKVGFPGSPVGY